MALFPLVREKIPYSNSSFSDISINFRNLGSLATISIFKLAVLSAVRGASSMAHLQIFGKSTIIYCTYFNKNITYVFYMVGINIVRCRYHNVVSKLWCMKVARYNFTYLPKGFLFTFSVMNGL